MKLLSKLQNMEKKYAFGFFGIVLAIIFGTLSIYTTFFQKKSPAITFEIESSASVFDIREDVGKLDVIFNGVNLRETGQTLTLMTLKISNTGSEPVLKTSYDDNDPLGFEISSGEIAKAELLRASKLYLTKNLNITEIPQTNSTSATFSPVIIEPGDVFWVKILILHKEKTVPALKPIGTIAGVGEIAFVDLNAKEKKQSLWEQVTNGTIWVQLMRAVVYFFGFICGMFVVLIPVALIGEFFGKKKRKSEVASFQKSASSIRPEFEWVINYYIENGSFPFGRVREYLNHPQKVYEYADNKHIGFHVGTTPRHLRFRALVYELINKKIIIRTDGKITVDEDFRKFIDEFSKFVGSSTLEYLENGRLF
jgi:hypothetical protein